MLENRRDRRLARAGIATLAMLGVAGGAAAARPTAEELRAAAGAAWKRAAGDVSGLPIRLGYAMTAQQRVPVYTVLAGGSEGDEPIRYEMTHPLFAFEWADGRIFVVDPGINPDDAQDFSRSLRVLGAGAPCTDARAWQPLTERIGDVRGVAFTHLHIDHVSGLRELCTPGRRIPVLLGAEQAGTDERFELAGLRGVEKYRDEGCIELTGAPKTGGPLHVLAGLPGVYRIPVGGHTPGSQIFLGFVADEGEVSAFAVVGDVVNHRNGFLQARAKPWWYRNLVVREDDDRQAELRRLLRGLHDDGVTILVNHDLLPSIDSGIESLVVPVCSAAE